MRLSSATRALLDTTRASPPVGGTARPTELDSNSPAEPLFLHAPNEGPGNALGDGGHRLHEWAMTHGDVDLDAVRRSGGVNGKVVDEFMSTGAVVAGQGTLGSFPPGPLMASFSAARISRRAARALGGAADRR